MTRPLLVFENINTTPRRRIFRILGVEVMATPYAWLSIPFFCLLGVLVAFGQRPRTIEASSLYTGVAFGLFLYSANALHSLGHILAARIVRAPMEILLLTGTRDVTIYRNVEPGPSKGMYIGRSLGGPLANVVVGFMSFIAWHFLSARWLFSFAVFNVIVAAWTLCPVPSMDGWVIWGEVFGFRKHGTNQ